MPKYIDADALKEAFLIEGKDVCDAIDDFDTKWGASQKLIEEVIDSAPAADVEPKRRWIPVTERFPKPVSAQTRKKTKPVLLYSPKGGFYVGWYFGEDYRHHHIFANRTSRDS